MNANFNAVIAAILIICVVIITLAVMHIAWQVP